MWRMTAAVDIALTVYANNHSKNKEHVAYLKVFIATKINTDLDLANMKSVMKLVSFNSLP